jgi:hypothetical protein
VIAQLTGIRQKSAVQCDGVGMDGMDSGSAGFDMMFTIFVMAKIVAVLDVLLADRLGK